MTQFSTEKMAIFSFSSMLTLCLLVATFVELECSFNTFANSLDLDHDQQNVGRPTECLQTF